MYEKYVTVTFLVVPSIVYDASKVPVSSTWDAPYTEKDVPATNVNKILVKSLEICFSAPVNQKVKVSPEVELLYVLLPYGYIIPIPRLRARVKLNCVSTPITGIYNRGAITVHNNSCPS